MANERAAAGHRVTMFTNIDEPSETDGVRYVPAGQIGEHCPLGEMFHYYAENTPCDVMIIQRHPKAFAYNWASKINLWWIHDLALQRSKAMVEDMMVNIDGILTVSEWHKKQVCEVYGINEDVVYAVTNGVDLSLFEGSVNIAKFACAGDTSHKQTRLLYTSRPARGLENLVKADGIMERLLAIDPNYHLYICGYDNVTAQMKNYYDALYARADALPNVTNLGALTKQELADVMRQCDLHVYPSTFEETSCITAMECMAAGLPMIASNVGALPETTESSGITLVNLVNDEIDIDTFLTAIEYCNKEANSKLQLERAPNYSWEVAAVRMLSTIQSCFKVSQVSEASIIQTLLMNSDFYAANTSGFEINNPIMKSLNKELLECYKFTNELIWDDHYASYYQYEEDRGVEYGPEDLSNNHRYLHVASIISNLPSGSVVLDYGCAHGHYTNNLAKANPDKTFVGIDITESNVIKARKWAEDACLSNISFKFGRVEDNVLCSSKTKVTLGFGDEFDCIIAAEVLEHVADPANHVDVLQQYLKTDGLMLITTPYGPWEWQGFKEQWPWRAHVHHFEREDLSDLWGSNAAFNVVNVPSGHTRHGDALGSYITTWMNTELLSGIVDYERKLNLVAPQQTLSCCMIVKDAASSIRRCLESVMPIVDELIIGFDKIGDSDTTELVSNYMKRYWPEKAYTAFEIDSPVEIGFDAARNSTIEKASGDWIMWIDADEFLHDADNIVKYLRNNQYNGYAIPQHHFSMEPVGVQKTDLPVRLFRNHKGIKFFGKVHEHPEQELNKGVGHVTVIEDVSILHDGYTDERTRRERFGRNIDLLLQDRKENPDRILGKFLWIRDLAQMSHWEMEDTNGRITDAMVARADEGIKLWRELLADGDLRIVVDSLSYYSTLSRIKGDGFDMDMRFDSSKFGEAHADEVRPVHSYFNSEDDARALITMIFDERTKTYDNKYQ